MKSMEAEFTLSKESRKFIEDLRVYLFASGKNEDEITAISDELVDHLFEAEKKGKSIGHIIGDSPKAYMESISKEMQFDYRNWSKYIPIILFGGLSFSVVTDLFDGPLSYSLLQIIGFLAIGLIFLVTGSLMFRFLATNRFSRTKEFILLGLAAFLPIALFVGLLFLNDAITTPTINFGLAGSIFAGIVCAAFIIGISIWSKTIVLPVIIGFVALPEYLLRFTALGEESQLIIGTIITFGGILGYILLESKKSEE